METTSKQFKKRNAILAYLQNTNEHPSAEMVYAGLKPEFPNLSLGTVYRNLAKFREEGAVISIGTVSGIERFDGCTDPHVHFICTGCDAVLDMPRVQIPETIYAGAARNMDLTVDSCQLSLTGLCAECNMKREGGESA